MSYKRILKYVPHGIDSNKFYPIDQSSIDFNKFKNKILNGKEYDFTLFYNSRNLRRKSTPDLILSFKVFLDMLPEDKREKCCLILHTDPVDNNGTDLLKVIEMLFGTAQNNILISSSKIDTNTLNYFYNLADATILLSSNEGWGLSLTESLMAGTMIIANVTGGMQDQMRFEDSNGEWINFTEEFGSNHRGKFKKCGDWAIPVFPNNISLIGSPVTPYIFDDKCSFEDVSKSIYELYNMSKSERNIRGIKGREWVMSDESMMSSKNMCLNIIEGIDKTLNNFKPRKQFELIKVKDYKDKYLKYPIS
jgi:hypothetical protein